MFNLFCSFFLIKRNYAGKFLLKKKRKWKRQTSCEKSSSEGSKKGSFISVWNVLNALNNLNLPCILNILISSRIEIPLNIIWWENEWNMEYTYFMDLTFIEHEFYFLLFYYFTILLFYYWWSGAIAKKRPQEFSWDKTFLFVGKWKCFEYILSVLDKASGAKMTADSIDTPFHYTCF